MKSQVETAALKAIASVGVDAPAYGQRPVLATGFADAARFAIPAAPGAPTNAAERAAGVVPGLELLRRLLGGVLPIDRIPPATAACRFCSV